MALHIFKVALQNILEALLQLGRSKGGTFQRRRVLALLIFGRVASLGVAVFLDSLTAIRSSSLDAQNVPAEGLDKDNEQRQIHVLPIVAEEVFHNLEGKRLGASLGRR